MASYLQRPVIIAFEDQYSACATCFISDEPRDETMSVASTGSASSSVVGRWWTGKDTRFVGVERLDSFCIPSDERSSCQERERPSQITGINFVLLACKLQSILLSLEFLVGRFICLRAGQFNFTSDVYYQGALLKNSRNVCNEEMNADWWFIALYRVLRASQGTFKAEVGSVTEVVHSLIDWSAITLYSREFPNIKI